MKTFIRQWLCLHNNTALIKKIKVVEEYPTELSEEKEVVESIKNTISLKLEYWCKDCDKTLTTKLF